MTRRAAISIGGWSLQRIALGFAAIAALVWAAWATRTLLELRERRIVAVSLSRLVEDFVAAEARNPADPEQAGRRTAAYLSRVDRALATLARDGTVVIVSEATLANSVPDRTEELRRGIAGESADGAR